MGLDEYARIAMDQAGPIAGRPRGGSRDILIGSTHRQWALDEADRQGLRVYPSNRWHLMLRDGLAQGFQVYTAVLPSTDVYVGVAQAMLAFDEAVRSGGFPRFLVDPAAQVASDPVAERKRLEHIGRCLRDDCQRRIMGVSDDYATSITANSSVEDTLARLLADALEVDLAYNNMGAALGALTRTAAANLELVDTARALESVQAPPRLALPPKGSSQQTSRFL